MNRVDPESIKVAYTKLTDEQIKAVGDSFLENQKIMDIIHNRKLNDIVDDIHTDFENTYNDGSTRENLLISNLEEIMKKLQIDSKRKTLDYINFWNALASAIDTIKPSLNSSSSSATLAAPLTSAAAPSTSVAAVKQELPPGISQEDYNALGGGRRRRRNRKTKRTRKTRKTHRKNKKRSA